MKLLSLHEYIMGYQGNILFMMHECSSISSILHHIAINLQPEPDITFLSSILNFQREEATAWTKEHSASLMCLKTAASSWKGQRTPGK